MHIKLYLIHACSMHAKILVICDVTKCVCVPACMQLFKVSSANEWKTIKVSDMFEESDEEVFVKCSTWTADGKRIICAARNAALVSYCEHLHLSLYIVMSGRDAAV